MSRRAELLQMPDRFFKLELHKESAEKHTVAQICHSALPQIQPGEKTERKRTVEIQQA